MLGLTTYLQQAQTGIWDVRASFLPAIYIDGVNLAGGIAALLPPQPVDAEIASRVLDGLDGLIITGGRDVDPAVYGQQPHPATDEATADNRQRDAFEFALVDGAIRRPGLDLGGGSGLLGHVVCGDAVAVTEDHREAVLQRDLMLVQDLIDCFAMQTGGGKCSGVS